MSLKSKTEEDNGFVFIEGEEVDKEYEEVNPDIQFKTKPCTTSEFNGVIKKLITKEKYVFQGKKSDPANRKICYSIFQNQEMSRRVLLFDVVTDRSHIDLACLDEAFGFYKVHTSQIKSKEDVLIIPVFDVAKRQFKLLVIDNQKINYYDSIDYLTSQQTHLTSALLYSFMEASKEVIIDRAEEEIPSSYFQRALLIGQILGEVAGKTLFYYPEHYRPVQQICHEYFPNMEFIEHALGHQSNQGDSDAYTASYLQACLQGKTPDKKEDALEIRARLAGVPDRHESVTTTVNTEDNTETSGASLQSEFSLSR